MKQTEPARQLSSARSDSAQSAPVLPDEYELPNAPFHQLTVREGKLFHVPPASPAVEILDTPQLEIMEKAGVIDLPGAEVAFLFRLNHLSDEIWARDFAARLNGVKAEIQGAQLELRCPPSELQRAYAQIKSALTGANKSYATFRAQLCERVSEHEAQQTNQSETAEQKANAAHAAWEQLEL